MKDMDGEQAHTVVMKT